MLAGLRHGIDWHRAAFDAASSRGIGEAVLVHVQQMVCGIRGHDLVLAFEPHHLASALHGLRLEIIRVVDRSETGDPRKHEVGTTLARTARRRFCRQLRRGSPATAVATPAAVGLSRSVPRASPDPDIEAPG